MSVLAADVGLERTFAEAIRVERVESEVPLFVFAVIVSLLLWVLLTISIVGIIYAAAIGAFVFLAQVAFITHIRGSGVRLGPDQFPELYERVRELAGRMGMKKVPEAYLLQADGSLNALATRFLRAHMLVLFSDLLEACGDDHAARDMIIGHELGHIHAGHLKWHWFLLPSHLMPFLSGALSRAREYTCDRYGYASAGEREGALLGLTILAAGGRHGRRVNREAMVRQRRDLNTGWMTIGQWLSTHPPLSKRLLALEPSLGTSEDVETRGTLRAIAIMGLMLLPFFAGGWLAVRYVLQNAAEIRESAQAQASLTSPEPSYVAPPPARALQQLQASVTALSAFLEGELAAGRGLPAEYDELAQRWAAAHPDEDLPVDPFDGVSLDYERTETGYLLWSSGPDQQPGSEDDLTFPFEP